MQDLGFVHDHRLNSDRLQEYAEKDFDSTDLDHFLDHADAAVAESAQSPVFLLLPINNLSSSQSCITCVQAWLGHRGTDGRLITNPCTCPSPVLSLSLLRCLLLEIAVLVSLLDPVCLSVCLVDLRRPDPPAAADSPETELRPSSPCTVTVSISARRLRLAPRPLYQRRQFRDVCLIE